MDKRLPLPAGTVLQGRYRILRQLGHGGFGAVYEAVDDELKLSFALKETFYAADEELRQAFKREARMLASLSHEAFPRVTHYFTENDGCFLVMELIFGDDLDKLLAKRGAPFETEQILIWADQILDALEDLHASGIIHRDIKPSNLKLTPKGKIKLLDFGIAKGVLEGETTIMTTVGSMAAATLQYAPLEQVLKASPQHQMMLAVISSERVVEVMKRGTNAASDLYALAATLYQLLTKTLPADAATRALAIWSGQGDRLVPPSKVNPQVSQAVSEVLEKALSINQGERQSSAAEMRQMLRDAVRPPVDETQPPPIIRKIVKVPDDPVPPKDEIDKQKGFRETNDKPNNSARNALLFVFGLIFISVILLIIGVGIKILVSPKNNNSGNTANSALSNKNTNSNRNSSNNNANSAKPTVDNKFELAQTLGGHTDTVKSVAFSSDGKTLASGSSDQTIKIWNAASGVLRKTLSEQSSAIYSVAFSPVGSTLASGGIDKTIKLWNVENGKLIAILKGHEDAVDSVAYSMDGEMLASSGLDRTIKIWDAEKVTLKQNINGRSFVLSVAFSPDGKTLASGNVDNTVRLWDTESGTLIKTLNGHTGVIGTVAFSPDGKTLASGSTDKTIKIWDVSSGALKQTLTGHNDSVGSVQFSPDEKTLASGSNDKTIRIWDASSGALKQTLTGHNDFVMSIAFSPDGKTLASGSSDKTIKLWRLKE